MILAIDPGPKNSAYAVLSENNLSIQKFEICKNQDLLNILAKSYKPKHVAMEMIASYGMAVGKEVFETCVWIGRFEQALRNNDVENLKYIYRKDEKMNLCGSMKAKDSNIRQALIDRFGVVGTKGKPGWFYGVSKDVWAAIAVGVTYFDLYVKDLAGRESK